MHADGLTYCILDSITNKFLHLETFDLGGPVRKPHIPGDPEKTDPGSLLRLLDNELQWLTQPFSKVRVLIEQGKSTLIPEALFVEEEKRNIFNFNIAGGNFQDIELKHDHLTSIAAYGIYQLPGAMATLIGKYFAGAQVFHHSTAFIQSLFLKFRNADSDRQLFVNTAASRLDILQIKNKRLDYYNSFLYNTAEDFMYYLVFVVEQLNLNPESLEMVLMGEIEKHSPLADLILKYIRHVKFIERNADFRYSFVFDQLPGHYYYNLLNASLCE
jgi:hypothetical protein